MQIAVWQHDFPVGDVAGNVRRVISLAEEAASAGADLAIFPELTLAGYPPEDLVLREGFIRACQDGLRAICHAAPAIDLLVGLPLLEEGDLFNALVWIRDGHVIGTKRKEALPNYAVFDEKRYFQSAPDVLVVEHCGVRCGVLVCEDLWVPGPAARLAKAGADLIVCPNASPYHRDKWQQRAELFAERASETGLPVAYLNLVGGQDELVFDGASCMVDGAGKILEQAPAFVDETQYWTFSETKLTWDVPEPTPPLDPLARDYAAMVRGTRDYVRKNGFSDVVLGLSGGIDSALVLAIAVDALGAEHVHAVMMPSRFTSQLSLDLAAEQAELLGVRYQSIDIEGPFAAFTETLSGAFAGVEPDVTEENLQSRSRGTILMALSNKFGSLVLTTGNKSEYAVGYATIYGDMCGGFAPIKDCSKTRVFDICRWLNRDRIRIAPGIIERPPSAELREDQKDSDSLPPYDVLDAIISRYVELDQPRGDIIDAGFDAETVDRVIALIYINEWKRRQSAPGARITPRAFGRDRRYPITNRYR